MSLPSTSVEIHLYQRESNGGETQIGSTFYGGTTRYFQATIGDGIEDGGQGKAIYARLKSPISIAEGAKGLSITVSYLKVGSVCDHFDDPR
jgi:hypothetical protein